jgi:hypothetical protein
MRELTTPETLALTTLEAAGNAFDALDDLTVEDFDTKDAHAAFRAIKNIIYARPAFEARTGAGSD